MYLSFKKGEAKAIFFQNWNWYYYICLFCPHYRIINHQNIVKLINLWIWTSKRNICRAIFLLARLIFYRLSIYNAKGGGYKKICHLIFKIFFIKISSWTQGLRLGLPVVRFGLVLCQTQKLNQCLIWKTKTNLNHSRFKTFLSVYYFSVFSGFYYNFDFY